MITKNANAKVNLTLDIVGRLENGYHLVRMVMQSLDLSDILTFELISARADDRIQIYAKDARGTDPRAMNVEGMQTNVGTDENSGVDASTGAGDPGRDIGSLPLGRDNLIYKAADVLLSNYVWPRYPRAGVRITLEKHIPIAAGMAGGSSDAAATLKGVAELFDLHLTNEELMKIGVKLGADVPYCILGGTALSEGIGEQLTRLPKLPECYFLVVKPNISVSTAEAYGSYDQLVESRKRIRHPDVDGQVDAIYAGNLTGVSEKLGNVLEYVTAERYPIIKSIEKKMVELGAMNAIMSGSGPTVFGMFPDKTEAEIAEKIIKGGGLANEIYVVRSIS